MKYQIAWTAQFKKDYKLAMKRHLDIELIPSLTVLHQKKQRVPLIP